ncbi:hypothetical protein ACROYT_G032426 [Oculina patagonica]
MEQRFEKSLCLGTGIPFVLLSIAISVPNALILIVLYRNPLRCFRKTFSVFLAFIAAVDLFVGIVVCAGEAVMRLLCAFADKNVPTDGDIIKVLGYIGVNSSIVLVTAMSVDRFLSTVYPHFYLRKIKPRKLVFCNSIIIVFSLIFALLQLADISIDVYITIDIHLHTTFPLATSTLAYLGIFCVLRKRSRVGFQREASVPANLTLRDIRQRNITRMERKLATISFLILLFLVLSLVPYFIAILLEANCTGCRGQKWLFVLRESAVIFLFLNSTVNPFLTIFRINELKLSVKIILGLRRQNNSNSSGNFQQRTSLANAASS